MPKVSALHAQRRRDQILAAAMACFAHQGYQATSMEDIVRASGLSMGALYTYFPSKQDLFLALADQRTALTIAGIRALFDEPGPLQAKLLRAVDSFFDQLDDALIPLARVSIEFWGEATRSEALQARHQQRVQGVRDFLHWLLAEAQRAGEVRPDVDLDAAVELIAALHDGLLLHHVNGVQPLARDHLKAAYIAFLNAALGTPERPLLALPPLTPAPAAKVLAC